MPIQAVLSATPQKTSTFRRRTFRSFRNSQLTITFFEDAKQVSFYFVAMGHFRAMK